jgi:hypothetical protein
MAMTSSARRVDAPLLLFALQQRGAAHISLSTRGQHARTRAGQRRVVIRQQVIIREPQSFPSTKAVMTDESKSKDKSKHKRDRDAEENRFSARAARYARVGANVGGVAAKMVATRLLRLDPDRARSAARRAGRA